MGHGMDGRGSEDEGWCNVWVQRGEGMAIPGVCACPNTRVRCTCDVSVRSAGRQKRGLERARTG